MKSNDFNVGLFYDWQDVPKGFIYTPRKDYQKKEAILQYMRDVGDVVRDEFGIVVNIPGKFENFSNLLSLFCDSKEGLVAPLHYVLSRDRTYSPKIVSCSNRDYDWVEDILKKERGDSAKIVRGFTGWFSNERHMKFPEKLRI